MKKAEFKARVSADVDVLWPAIDAAERIGACTPFQSAFWLKAWMKHMLREKRDIPFIVEVRDPLNQLVMAMPLLRTRAYGLSTIVGVDADLSDYVAPLLATDQVDDATCAGIAAAFYSGLPNADLLKLHKLPLTLGRRKLRNPLVTPDARLMPFSTHAVPLTSPWDTFVTEKISTSSRATRRRKSRKLRQKGAVEFDVVEDLPTRMEALDFIVRERAQRAKDQEWGNNVLADSAAVDFCRTLVSNPEMIDFVHISTIRVGGEMIAVHLGFVYQNELFWYFPTFRGGEWAAFSPGQMLLDLELEWATQHGLSTLDLTIGDERYKQEWNPTSMPLFEVTLGMSIVGSAAVAAANARRHVGELIRVRKQASQNKKQEVEALTD